jgi:hypothetical protein
VKPWWIAIATLAAGSTAAFADAPDRCTQGMQLAATHDLPRAALYLESCNTDALDADTARTVRKTKADVAHKLDASKLSAMSIVTTPDGLVAETDAMPGERFTTPATIWAKAGDYKVNVAADAATLDAGKGITTTATLDAFSRRTVLINVPVKKAAPKDGKVDFNDDPNAQAAHSGPPPPIKHVTILPKKYLHPGAPSGPQLDDPFAYRDDGSLAWHLGARIGGGIYLRDASDTGPALAVSALAMRTLGGPVALTARVGWSHREIDSIGLDAGVAFRLAGTSSFVLSAGAALHGEVRVQDELAMQAVSRVGLGGAASLDLSLLSVPIVVGLRFEPSFTELVPGVRAHGLLVEVGYDWR